MRGLALALLLVLTGCAETQPEPAPAQVPVPQQVRERVQRAEGLVAQALRGDDRAGLLERAARELEGVPSVPEVRVVRGEIEYLQGNRAAAESEFSRATGLQDGLRKVDVLTALAWIAWQKGDLAEASRHHGEAMDLVQQSEPGPESWNPRWELACFYLTVLDGQDCDWSLMRQRERIYAQVQQRGTEDDPEFRETRQTLWEVARLRKAGKPLQAYALLEEQLDLEGGIEGTRDEPDSRRTRTFFSELQEEQDGVMYRLLVGDLLREGGRAEEAQRWYREVEARYPAHPALEDRLP